MINNGRKTCPDLQQIINTIPRIIIINEQRLINDFNILKILYKNILDPGKNNNDCFDDNNFIIDINKHGNFTDIINNTTKTLL